MTEKVEIIDATGLLLGRAASQIAKRALLGKNIVVVNCEKAVVSGSKKTLLARFKRKSGIGRPFHGPFTPRMPDTMVRRAVRGMVPFHKPRGREAYKRVMCYVGLPEEYQTQEAGTLESALAETKLKSGKTMPVVIDDYTDDDIKNNDRNRV